MKKLYAFFLSMLFVTALSAQTTVVTGMNGTPFDEGSHNQTNKVLTADSIFDQIPSASNFVYSLTAGSAGYVLGTSTETTETGVYYTSVGNGLVNELLVLFARKTVMGGTADSVTANVYTAGSDSMPGTLLGQGAVSVDDIDTTTVPNLFYTSIFISGVYSGSDFFVSLNYGSIDDSVMIFSTDPTPNNPPAFAPDGQQQKRTRQFYNTSSAWERAWDLWSFVFPPDTLNYDADAVIYPILDVTGAGNNPATTKDFSLYGAYPNPATAFTTIRYSLESAHQVSINIFDLSGRVIMALPATLKSAGTHEATFSLTELAAGKYYYDISTENTHLTSKFVVVK